MLVEEMSVTQTNLSNDLAVIESNYRLLVSNEYPILYTGKNPYNSWVVGSFLEEDDDDLTVLYYIHFVLRDIDYLDFISKRRSYKDIFTLSKLAFILQKDLRTLDIQKIYILDANEIPDDYLPHNNSYYPGTRKSHSLNYTVTLNGGAADSHHVPSQDSLIVQQAVADLLAESLNALPNLDVKAEIFQLAPTEGSFRLNFEVNVGISKINSNDLFFSKSLFSNYQNDLIEYAIRYLPTEVAAVYAGATLPEHFSALVQKTRELYNSLAVQIDEQELINAIKDSVYKAIDNIVKASSSMGSGYNSMEFIATSENIEENESIGSITLESKVGLLDTVDLIERMSLQNDEVEVDASPQPYKVYIYSLNAETRNGTGILVSEDGKVGRPRLSIAGKEPLEKTKFTQSLHDHQIIDVLATGTRTKGKLVRLIIEE